MHLDKTLLQLVRLTVGLVRVAVGSWTAIFHVASTDSYANLHCSNPRRAATGAPLLLFSVSRGMRMEAPRFATPYLKSVMAQVSCLPPQVLWVQS